jgi:NTE family protein
VLPLFPDPVGDAVDAAATQDVSRDPDFPCGPAGLAEDIGLALSGGGYRATLFHLGALWRLNQLGWLWKVERISTVSGGSLMAGVLASRWADLAWDETTHVATNFDELVVAPTLRFTDRPIDAFVIGLGLIPFVNPANVMDWVLHRTLTRRRRLADVPDKPRFVFNAANLATGVSWRFSPQYMGDSLMGVICAPDLRLSRAIAASAAYPPFVAPLVLDLRRMKLRWVRGARLFRDREHPGRPEQPDYPELRDRVLLLDGGAYDNLGVESVEGRCRIVLASDAGGNLSIDSRSWRYGFWWPLIRRTLDLAVEGGRRQRRRALIDNARAGRLLVDAGQPNPFVTERVALWRTLDEISSNPKLPAGWAVDEGWPEYLSRLSTRMWPMRSMDRKRLINWGYLTADLALRKRIPELEAAPAPSALPYPEAPLSERPVAHHWWER